MKFIAAVFSLCFSFLFSVYCQAEIHTNAEAINKAGLQRMLGQRIVKSYIMVGSGVKPMKAQQELDQAIAQFEQQHLELLDFAPSAAIANGLKQVSEIWQPFRLMAVERSDKDAARLLIDSSEQLFAASNNVVFLLEKYADTQTAKLVNISGKQRMLSQKIAKLYMAMAWHINDKGIQQSFSDSLKAYEQGLKTLQQAPQNNARIKAKLAKIDAQWAFSKAGFSQHSDGRFVPTLISVTTESMLNKMNELTADYQRLSEQGS